MKRIIFLMLMTVMLITTEVKATGLSSYLPLGKNYLDEENMTITSDSMSSNDPFKVKADTFYTLTLPGTDMLTEDVFVHIEGVISYLEGDILDLSQCVVEQQDVHCTFRTSATENLISLDIQANGILGYYTYYGFYDFQLEEGRFSTDYEAYIGPFVDSTNPEFSGSGAYIGSYVDNKPLSQIIAEHIVVADEIDGNLNDRIVIESNEYTTHETEVGEYNVMISACDNANNCAYFNLIIIIKDEILPVITGPNTVDIQATSLVSIGDIITGNFTYSDGYDPSCSLFIITDDYTLHKEQIGSYLVEFQVMDDSGNKAVKGFIVNVVDSGAPTIVGSTVYTSPLSNSKTIPDILNQLVISDSVNSYNELSIVIINDTYSNNSSTVGTYSFTVKVTDLSSNVATLDIVIHVIDDIAPNISGPSNYSYSYSEELVLNDFLLMLGVSDNYSNISLQDIYIITDTFSTRNSEVGEFQITFGVKDANLNESTHTISINIFDGVAPVIYIDNFIVTVNLSSSFGEEDALNLLINSSELEKGTYSSISLLDEYTGNEKKVGSYIQKYLFTNAQGEEFEKEFIIQVVGDEPTEWNHDLLIRNIIIYPIILGLTVFIYIKKKK